MNNPDITLLHKEIQFRATRRGMKELDLIFEKFLAAHLNALTPPQLEDLRILLLETDQDLFGWLTGERTVPNEKNSDVYQLLAKMVTSKA